MIKLILLDVDGTLTDGGIYRDNKGEEFKKFNVKDGYIIVNACDLGIDFGIITGKKSELVRIRSEELKMKYWLEIFCHWIKSLHNSSGSSLQF